MTYFVVEPCGRGVQRNDVGLVFNLLFLTSYESGITKWSEHQLFKSMHVWPIKKINMPDQYDDDTKAVIKCWQCGV